MRVKIANKKPLSLLAIIMLLAITVFGAFTFNMMSSPKALAANPPAGTVCPDKYTYSTDGKAPLPQQTWVANECNGDEVGNSCPAGYTEHDSERGPSPTPGVTGPVLPNTCSGAPAKPAAKPTSQADCNKLGTGQIYKNGACVAPANQSECSAAIPGSTYEGDGGPYGVPSLCSYSASSSNSSSGTAKNGPEIKCETSIINPLTWLICPIVNAAQELVYQLNNAIDGILTIDTASKNSVFNTSGPSGQGFQTAWNSFRSIALGLIIIGGLAMVIAQAAGAEILDAYTIRKVLPRLLIAAVFITLSWYVLGFCVQLTNDIGNSLREIIYQPFMNSNFSNGDINISADGVLVANLVGGVALLGLGLVGLGTFALTAIIAVVVGFVVLVIRNLVIMLCIILSPIAIACYVLPNTQKAWVFWRDTLMSMLLAFPIISAFIAVGRVFSIVAYTSGGTGSSMVNGHGAAHGFAVLAHFLNFGATAKSPGLLATIEAFIAFFLPYFFLSKAITMAHGGLGKIAGMGDGIQKGLRDTRKRKLSENMQAMKAGTRTNNRAFNALTARATTSRFGLGKRGKEAYEQKMAGASEEFGKSQRAAAVQHNDPLLQAMTYGSAMEARAKMGRDFGKTDEQVEEAIAGVKASGGFGKARQVWAAKQLAATGTGYKDTAEMYATVARVAGNNKSVAHSMWGEMRGTSERAGRNDLKAGYGMGAETLDDIMDSGAKGTQEVRQQFDHRFTELGIDAARGVDNVSVMRNKPASLRNMVSDLEKGSVHYEQVANSTTATAAERADAEIKLGQIRAKLENLKNYTSYGPEVNAEAVHGARTIHEDGTVERGPGVVRSAGQVEGAQERHAPGSATPYTEESQNRIPPDDARRRLNDPDA